MSNISLKKLNKISRELSISFSFVRFNVSLKNYNSLKVGGTAWAVAEPKDQNQLIAIQKFSQSNNLPYFVIGFGSNVIPHDRGFMGLIISTRKVHPQPSLLSSDMIETSCGTYLPRLVMFCQKSGLSGLEWGIGIPGTVGGAIWMNAGAGGRDISKIVEEISFWDGARIQTVHREELKWRYRGSYFQDHSDLLILSALFRFELSTPEKVRKAINNRLETIKRSQPRSYPSAGTVFKSGIKTLPGLASGLQVGDMKCPEENPSWIINLGEGLASQVYRLILIVMWRHLWRGLPFPKIEPIFIPYDISSEISPTKNLNNPPTLIRQIAKVTKYCRNLVKRM